MSGVKPSKHQKNQRASFARAAAYAKAIVRDPVKKASYNRKAKRLGKFGYTYPMIEFFKQK